MQKNKIIPIILGIVIVAGVMFLVLIQSTRSNKVDNKTYSNETFSSTTTQEQPTIKSQYTLAQVATHNDSSSCWSAINGFVYDLTSWISNHPGGEGAILSICGKDGSNAFNNQHGGQGRPENILETFKIGTLIK